MRRLSILTIMALLPLWSLAQSDTILTVNRQQSFPETIPAGNYSGIAWLGGNRYAVVDDKAPTSGYHLFTIDIDTVTGRIRQARSEGFVSSGTPNRDEEGIAYVPQTNTLFISAESDNEALEYGMDGRLTGRRLHMSPIFKTATRNRGLEALTYNAQTHSFWTTSESTLPADGPQGTLRRTDVRNRLRLQRFDEQLQPAGMYYYEMEPPTVDAGKSGMYALGVSALCALDDGRLIVLEREFYTPKGKFGSFVLVKLFVVNPVGAQEGALLPKTELLRVRTTFNLFNQGIANYEGLCMGPELPGGRRVFILVSDSQNQYADIMQDWLKTFVVQMNIEK